MTDSSATTIGALLAQLDWLRVTLSSIGDAVITTDRDERVTFLNPVAESLTGWSLRDAVGQPLSSVFRLINEENRLPVESPTVKALHERAEELVTEGRHEDEFLAVPAHELRTPWRPSATRSSAWACPA